VRRAKRAEPRRGKGPTAVRRAKRAEPRRGKGPTAVSKRRRPAATGPPTSNHSRYRARSRFSTVHASAVGSTFRAARSRTPRSPSSCPEPNAALALKSSANGPRVHPLAARDRPPHPRPLPVPRANVLGYLNTFAPPGRASRGVRPTAIRDAFDEHGYGVAGASTDRDRYRVELFDQQADAADLRPIAEGAAGVRTVVSFRHRG